MNSLANDRSWLKTALNEFETMVLADAELSRIYRRFISLRDDVDGISPADADRMVSMIHILFGNYEKAYYTRQYGVLGESEWPRFERSICINLRRARTLDRGLNGLRTATVSEEFASYVFATCEPEG